MAWSPHDRTSRAAANGIAKSLLNILFSFRGRVNRLPFWLFIIAASTLCLFILALGRYISVVVIVIFLGMYLWVVLALCSKRLHDRNRSAWILLGTAVPFIGLAFFLWVLIEAFLPGTTGENRYGGDPLKDPAHPAFVLASLSNGTMFSWLTAGAGWIAANLRERAMKRKEAQQYNSSKIAPEIVVKEVRHNNSTGGLWILIGLIAIVVGGYFFVSDWAQVRHKELHTLREYVNGIGSAWEDQEYVKGLGQRVSDFMEWPNCKEPNRANPCFMEIYRPIRLYPTADTSTFLWVPAGSILKITAIPSNAYYAFARITTLDGVVPTGLMSATACTAEQKCSVNLEALNAAGIKPAPLNNRK